MNILQKIIKYGIYLLAFLVPLQARWIIRPGELAGGYSEYSAISLYGIDILIVFLLVCFFVFQLKARNFSFFGKKIPTILIILAGIDLAFFVSIFMAADKILALYRYLFFLMCIGVFWLLVEGNYKRIKLIWFFLAGLVVQAGLGVWQFLTQSSFSNKWLGIAAHDPSLLGTSVVEAFDQGRWLRSYGALDHPNILGAFLAVGVILIIFLFIYARKKDYLQKLFLLAICPFLVVALFFTFSRAAWLGLILGILVTFILIYKKEYRQQFRKGVLMLLVIISTFSIMFFTYDDLVKVRFSNETRLENISYNQRIDSLTQGTRVIKDNWFLGVGAGNYTIELSSIIPGKNSWDYQPIHNTFLLIWSEIGVFGLAFFIFLFIYLFNQGLKFGNASMPVVLIVIILMMTFDHWWWSLHSGFLFLWFVLGLLYARHKVK